jgi:hypothetical protein
VQAVLKRAARRGASLVKPNDLETVPRLGDGISEVDDDDE